MVSTYLQHRLVNIVIGCRIEAPDQFGVVLHHPSAQKFVTQRPLASKEVQARTDEELKQVILKGQGKMKPVAGVTEKQAADVVAFVRTLK